MGSLHSVCCRAGNKQAKHEETILKSGSAGLAEDPEEKFLTKKTTSAFYLFCGALERRALRPLLEMVSSGVLSFHFVTTKAPWGVYLCLGGMTKENNS